MSKPLIASLAGLDVQVAVALTEVVGQSAYCVKVHDFLDGFDQRARVMILKRAGALKLWDDVKLHDIPKTVGRRAKALKKAGVDIITVHGSGGPDMIAAAVESGLEIYVVSVLTSLGPEQTMEIYGAEAQDRVLTFAQYAASAGAAGFVCSALELKILKSFKLKKVVPGTRSKGVALGEQKRSAEPAEALTWGADHLVIESQLLDAPDPAAEWKRLLNEIAAAA